ncbi:GL21553 [Drosophila persimilis]|uniref:GL21553 n=2 Tax=Drosophila persimilis TaxID=7234 RepID=B4GFV3_DROPE|nr:GL21553 [Drosophila persimilis]
MNGTVLHPAKDISIHARVLKRENGYKPWLFDFHVDVCRYLQKPNIPVANLIYGLFKEFSNINHTCPFVGPQIVKDFYLKFELLRLPLPTGDYMLSLLWFFDKKLQFDTNVSFTFVEDLLQRN